MRHAWLSLALLAACQVATGPVDPVWGKEACGHCVMLLSDRQAAAQVQLDDGSHVHFDDIGCMLEWLAHGDRALRGQWVRQVDGKGWVDARAAHYAVGRPTPMDYGLLPAHTGLSYESARAVVRERSAKRKETMR